MNYELTRHARNVLEEREISQQWMEHVIDSPELIEPSDTDPTLESRFARIVESDNRVLRVVVNKAVVPVRVVSVYFDRTMKGKI